MTIAAPHPVSPALPPGPAAPPMAQALRWIGRPYEFMRECAQQFGDVKGRTQARRLAYRSVNGQ